MIDDITEEEKEKINKYLMRALDNLCRIEKLLKDIKGSDSNGGQKNIQQSGGHAEGDR